VIRSRAVLFALLLLPLAACSGEEDGLLDPGVTVIDVALPVAGAVYRGTEAHAFPDQQVTLFCGRHGTFSASAAPPEVIGETVQSEYTAMFEGELVLEPPAVPSAVTYPLSVPARMAERITLSSVSGDTRTFDTELVTFELQGSVMPEGIMVRESTDRASAGVTTITALSGGQSRVETRYDVWLEISRDGGRTWHLADNAVRMTLEPR
jgi:hypothetical protein